MPLTMPARALMCVKTCLRQTAIDDETRESFGPEGQREPFRHLVGDLKLCGPAAVQAYWPRHPARDPGGIRAIRRRSSSVVQMVGRARCTVEPCPELYQAKPANPHHQRLRAVFRSLEGIAALLGDVQHRVAARGP